jgi:hypothetical protein
MSSLLERVLLRDGRGAPGPAALLLPSQPVLRSAVPLDGVDAAQLRAGCST